MGKNKIQPIKKEHLHTYYHNTKAKVVLPSAPHYCAYNNASSACHVQKPTSREG